jgi:Holliday junction DNA helicase RuvB
MTMTDEKKITLVADLSDQEISVLYDYYQTQGPSAEFTEVQYEALAAERDRRAALAPKDGLSDLRQWAQTKVAAHKPAVTKDDAPSDDEAKLPSVKDRPSALSDIVGQTDLVGQLRFVIAGAKLRGVPVAHCLLVGPAGHGKTSIASILAEEAGAELVCANAMVLKKPADLIGLLVKASSTPTVIFLDEIHNLSSQVQETLYSVMEDRKVDIIAGSGMDATAYSHELPSIIICGATTRPGLLSEPFRQRFGFIGQMDIYTDLELAEIVRRSWERVGFVYGENEPYEVAKRSRGVPRRALTLGERVLDYVSVGGDKNVAEGVAGEALAVFGIDHHGLDEVDYQILDCLVNRHGGQTIGLDSLAVACDLDPKTISDDHEPFLVRSNLVARTSGGRMALPPAFELMKEREAA